MANIDSYGYRFRWFWRAAKPAGRESQRVRYGESSSQGGVGPPTRLRTPAILTFVHVCININRTWTFEYFGGPFRGTIPAGRRQHPEFLFALAGESFPCRDCLGNLWSILLNREFIIASTAAFAAPFCAGPIRSRASASNIVKPPCNLGSNFWPGNWLSIILGFRVMSNDLHVVARNRPDLAAAWSDDEVARRWWNVFPKRRTKAGLPAEPRDFELLMITFNPNRLAEIRRRMSDVSWFMRCLVEPIARQANREDSCSGRFWQGR